MKLTDVRALGGQVATRLATLLAGPSDRALSRHEVLEAEAAHLDPEFPVPPGTGDTRQRLEALYEKLHARPRAAICLSGGGIRSASFAVGVLEGLARRGILSEFHFLSTVSGGGYTGAWLSAWQWRSAQSNDGASPCAQLGGRAASVVQPEPEPVSRIRENSNYLDPEVGVFSADVWTLVATVLRNLLLNWAVLVPVIAAALLVPRIYEALLWLGVQDFVYHDSLMTLCDWFGIAAAALCVIGLTYIVFDLPTVGNHNGDQRAFLVACWAPLCTAAFLMTLYWAWWRILYDEQLDVWLTIGFGVSAHLLPWAASPFVGRKRFRPITWSAAAITGALAGGMVLGLTHVFPYPLRYPRAYTTLAFPLLLLIVCVAGTVFVGMTGEVMEDEDREWWSRLGAWLLIAGAGWITISAIVLFGPDGLRWLQQRSTLSPAQAKSAIALLTGALGGLAAKASGRPSTGNETTWQQLRPFAFAIAAPLFVVLLLAAISGVDRIALRWLDVSTLHWPWFEDLRWMQAYQHCADGGVPCDSARLPVVVGFLAALAGAGVLSNYFISVNRFSLHGMYRDRLMRAFLGASRPVQDRRPNRFTGFDPEDNVRMWQLADVKKPLHVINTTLNLVAERTLAWQERKAASFTISALHAGGQPVGYRPVKQFGGSRGISLGTAMTISGAAVSPNAGSQSSPALAFLLMLFNARLGAWLGNPRTQGRTRTWDLPEPRFSAWAVISELFGRTTSNNPYVYLSDGGHFENLGLYEMVVRRCHTIVVSDAGADPEYAFEDLGNAVRKIRIDLGIPVEFDADAFLIDKAHAGKGNAHCAVGVIKYGVVDPGAPEGRLIYVKATTSGKEPVDIMNYATAHAAFPHESTANQWFGESAFESYRMLGAHAVAEIARAWAKGATGIDAFHDAACAYVTGVGKAR